jgi:hypothetical protein
MKSLALSLVGLLVFTLLGFNEISYFNPSPQGASLDPTKIVGSDRCANCHGESVNHWQETPHFLTFAGSETVEAMHRRPSADSILTRLQMRSAKRGECVACHYTEQATAERPRPSAIEGVSCESCHGAAADWVETHGVYGETATGEKASRETETPEHRSARLAQAAAAGQIQTDNLHAIIANCFDCHTVPNERLVNVGQHVAGSASFDYLTWLDDFIRHNFLYSNGAENRRAPRDYPIDTRRRQAFITAELVDLEYSLRGLSTASEDGPYAESLAARIQAARETLASAAGAAPALVSLIDQVNATLLTAEGKTPGDAAFAAASSAMSTLIDTWLQEEDGSNLAELDALIATR